MDRQAAVIRSEIDRTRCELDRKLTRLESRARDLDPRRYIPDNLLDRSLGALLTCLGSWMTWRHYRDRLRHRRVSKIAA